MVIFCTLQNKKVKWYIPLSVYVYTQIVLLLSLKYKIRRFNFVRITKHQNHEHHSHQEHENHTSHGNHEHHHHGNFKK